VQLAITNVTASGKQDVHVMSKLLAMHVLLNDLALIANKDLIAKLT
jgi:hypothetical protein